MDKLFQEAEQKIQNIGVHILPRLPLPPSPCLALFVLQPVPSTIS